jgi:SAM-dependent methyltransferase
VTKIWARLRYAHQDAFEDIGVDTVKVNFLLDHCKQRAGERFLEIGCFRGTRFSDPIIECAGNYTGINLSTSAITAFQKTVDEDGRTEKVTLIAGDLLEHVPDEQYDVLFAHGVLHHFESTELLFDKLNSLVKPGGIILCAEPLQVNRLFEFLRMLYRPFQSDKDWEWPFARKSVRDLEKYFTIERGFGWDRFSMPLSLTHMIPGIGSIMRPLYKWLLRKELGSKLSSDILLNSTVVLCCSSKKSSNG